MLPLCKHGFRIVNINYIVNFVVNFNFNVVNFSLSKNDVMCGPCQHGFPCAHWLFIVVSRSRLS